MESESSGLTSVGLRAPGTDRRSIRDDGCRSDDRFRGARVPKSLKRKNLPDPGAGEPSTRRLKPLDPMVLSGPESEGHSAADVKNQIQTAFATALMAAAAAASALKAIEKKEEQETRTPAQWDWGSVRPVSQHPQWRAIQPVSQHPQWGAQGGAVQSVSLHPQWGAQGGTVQSVSQHPPWPAQWGAVACVPPPPAVHPAFFPGRSGAQWSAAMMPSSPPGSCTRRAVPWPRHGGLPEEESSGSVCQAVVPSGPALLWPVEMSTVDRRWLPGRPPPPSGPALLRPVEMSAVDSRWLPGRPPSGPALLRPVETSTVSHRLLPGMLPSGAALVHPRSGRPVEMSPSPGRGVIAFPMSESMAMGSMEMSPSDGVSMTLVPESRRLVETLPLTLDHTESGSSPQAVAAVVPTSRMMSEEEKQPHQRWITSPSDVPPPPTTTRPLPPRCPPCPNWASKKRIREWNLECRKISKLAAEDPRYNLPFLKRAKNTFHAVTSTIDKTLVHKVASSVVRVSSVGQDGMAMHHYSGIILGNFNENERASILTSSSAVCDYNGELLNCKLLIYLPNKGELEANIVFYNPFYKIALLDILAGIPLAGLSFTSSPEEGDEVFVLSRNTKSSLIATKGTILCLEEPYSERNFFKYLSCELPECGIGGSVVDKYGDLSGIALKLASISSNAMIPSPIIAKCIEMQRKFRCIARPMHGLSLITVQSLSVMAKDRIFFDHNINTGYIVENVLINSTAENYDIRLGDIIVSFDGMHSHSLIELELHLLSLGWEFLERNLDAESKVILKLHVCDPLGDGERSIRLPVRFTCFTSTAKELCFSPTGTVSNGEDLSQDASGSDELE